MQNSQSQKKVVGKGNISAMIIAHSKSSVNGKEIITYELEYHRYIHSEVLTHRLFSRNSASSRAIPVEKMLELVRENPATPIHWGKNISGMQAKEECINRVDISKTFTGVNLPREGAWKVLANQACSGAKSFSKAGYHKQIVNRLTEPFQMMKVVCTATEFDNFFYLRKHPDAQPEIAELARVMWEAREQSTPEVLKAGEWHTPYVQHERGMVTDDNGYMDGETELFYKTGDTYLTLEEALKISASCCACVSYRNTDNSVEKAIRVYDRLVESKPVHASPFEHQATPIPTFTPTDYLHGRIWDIDGITHEDRNGNLWSGNFCGFIQHRQLIPDNTCWEYKE